MQRHGRFAIVEWRVLDTCSIRWTPDTGAGGQKGSADAKLKPDSVGTRPGMTLEAGSKWTKERGGPGVAKGGEGRGRT